MKLDSAETMLHEVDEPPISMVCDQASDEAVEAYSCDGELGPRAMSIVAEPPVVSTSG